MRPRSGLFGGAPRDDVVVERDSGNSYFHDVELSSSGGG
jgi:hypothetical protein